MSSGSVESSPSSSPGSQAAPAPTTITIPNGAPKFGTLVPNRVFVGGISSTTTESELHQLFSAFGNVKQTKIIQDRAGVSKGYGFVTFETEEEARRLQVQADNIVLKERKLNIAPAIKKQQTYCGRTLPYEVGQPILNGGYYYSPSGTPYTYHNGLAMFTSDTGQMTGQLTAPHPTLGLALQQVPGKATAQSSAQPLPLLYGPANTTAMFLPSASGTAISQQQIQLQTHINNVAAAVQSQSPTREGGKAGLESSSSGSPAWRWTSLSSPHTCHLPPSTAASQQLPTHQGINYAAAQAGSSGFLQPLETFHYIPSVFSTGLHHPPAGFVIPTPDRQSNY